MSVARENNKLVVAGMAALALVVFLLDIPFPMGETSAPLFVAVIAGSLWLPGRRAIFISAIACTVLTALGFFLSPPGPVEIDLINRACAVAAIWLVAILCVLYKRTDQRTQELAAIVESSDDAILSASFDGPITSWNAGAQRLFGYTADEAIGRPARFLIPPEFADEESRMLETIRRGEGVAHFETVRLRNDGGRVHVSLAASPVRGAHDVVVGMSSIIRDITEHKRTTEAKEAAEAASRAKSEFLASMSHEIRTPMNGVFGMLDLVLDTDLAPDQRHYLERARTSADLLLRVINDILDFSKIEAGRLDLEPAAFSLRESLGESIKAFGPRAHRKGLELALHVRPDTPDIVVGDAMRLGQVLTNLVGNAIKFTERGEVIVTVGLDQTAAPPPPAEGAVTIGPVCLHFEVTDTGTGIPAEKQQLIFGAFSQADSSMARRFGGTGLGLTISARLVELMGGRIWVESEVGKGSTFHFTACVDLQLEPAVAKRSAERVDLEGMPVLAADDNDTNRGILAEMLTNWRMRPTAVASGRGALVELRRAAAAGDAFPLVLLDAVMPDLDGFAVAEAIRGDPALAGATIMMLSSADLSGELARCQELGIAVYLRKPLKQSELLNAVQMALGLETETQSATSQAEGPPPDGMRSLRILVVEDNEFNQELAMKLLVKRGYSAVLAPDGKEALIAWEREKFDLILMDVQLPEMDGLAVTQAIRAKEQATGHARVPIVALTAHAMKRDRERCLAAGMDAYASKPIRAAELFAIIDQLLPSGAVAAGAPGAKTDSGAAFDVDTALSMVDGSRELLAQMGQSFIDRSARSLEELHDSALRGDAAAVERAAHRLKSAVGSLGAPRSYEAAQRMEQLGQAGDVAGFQPAYVELAEAVGQLREALADVVAKERQANSISEQ
jgi:PAS domain S-box-containing protein